MNLGFGNDDTKIELTQIEDHLSVIVVVH